jgi:riboflavin kinase/FMN adenylyltransferase
MLLARGVALHVVQPVTEGGLVVSSTKIREFLLEGNVEAAALLLTRPHDVEGVVERGAGRGRGFGFATANVRTEALLPAAGVYATRVLLGGRRDGATALREGGAPYDGVCNVGVKPTVEAAAPKALEVHLFDFEGRDLYGEEIRVGFAARLRDERRFPSVEALREQIARDVAAARAALRQPSTM